MVNIFRSKYRAIFRYIYTGSRWRLFGEIVFGTILIIVIGFAFSLRANSQIDVFYSLDRFDNDQKLVEIINDADKYIYFAIYFFTKENIADALIKAKERGVTVWGITDAISSKESNKHLVQKLRSAGIEVETQKHPEGIMHMKVLVTEKSYASGSYNWTASATNSNDEVLEIGSNSSVRKKYLTILKKVLLINE